MVTTAGGWCPGVALSSQILPNSTQWVAPLLTLHVLL